LTVLILSVMILMATILIYGRVRGSVETISARLEKQAIPDEILQKIAEDIDRLAAPGFDSTISIQNKIDTGYNSARLVIENRYYGNGEPPQANTYEQVVWQSMYDPMLDQMTLYRCHSGLNLEDALVDNMRSGDKNSEVFVPVCTGLTYFSINAMSDANEMTPQWQKQTMPTGILLKLSLESMVQMDDGSFMLPEESIVSRAVAVDRTRPIRYTLNAKLTEENDPNKTGNDPNKSASNNPNKTESSGGKKQTDAKILQKPNDKAKPQSTKSK
jgi:hypothetical protein